MDVTSEAPTELIPLVSAPPAEADAPAPPRRRRVLVVFAVVVVVLAGAVAGFWRWRAADAARRPADAPIAVQSVALVRQDLSTSESISGKLGYGTPRTLTGNREGTVTWLPRTGTKVTRGKQLLRVDDKPVPLFYGTIPLFRTISGRNTVGRDVRILADNLEALGYSIGYQPSPGERVAQSRSAPPASTKEKGKTVTEWVTVRKGEGVLTSPLIAAVKRWQADAGMPATGSVAVGDVLVLGGAVRVDSVAVQPGAPANGPLLAVTATDKVITVPLEVAQAGSIRRGAKVTVSLPDDKTVPGKVTAVGTAAAKPEEGGNTEQSPKVTVTVTVDDPRTVAGLDSADVEVLFAAETHENVLVAPIGALLALSEGGYAVQVRGGGLVRVETGMFAKGMVEISGAGLDAGIEVVTTS